MPDLNKVMVMGKLTRDVQVRFTPGGTAVAELGMAVNRKWFDKQSNQKKEEVTYIDVTLWGKQAELAGEYLSKGSGLFVEGRLQLEQWEDKTSGEKRSKMKVVGESMQFIGGKPVGAKPQQQKPKQAEPQDADPFAESEVPF